MKNNKGFTLIELLVAMFIITILLANINLILKNHFTNWSEQCDEIELKQNLNYGMKRILEDIKFSKKLLEVGKNYIIIENADATTIRYELAKDNFAEEHLFSIEGFTLYRKEGNGNRQPMANFITKLEFSFPYEANNFIEIKITGKLTEEEITYTSGVYTLWENSQK